MKNRILIFSTILLILSIILNNNTILPNKLIIDYLLNDVIVRTEEVNVGQSSSGGGGAPDSDDPGSTGVILFPSSPNEVLTIEVLAEETGLDISFSDFTKLFHLFSQKTRKRSPSRHPSTS